MRVSIAANQRYRVARLAAALATGLLYFWIIGIGDVKARFAWDSGLDTYYGLSTGGAVTGSNAVQGYYDLLGRSFANGKLRLPVEPSLDLLALANPWSDQMNRPYRLLDAVLFNEHYYLYHGPTPALLLFTPWYLITRHDLPENFAALALAFGSYLFFSALFTRALSTLTIRLPLAVYALFLLALGVSQSMPFLLHRVKVYEVAIACGCFCLSAGFYSIFRWLTTAGNRDWWAALSGLSFGLAIGSRPHLGLATIPVFFLLLFAGAPQRGTARRFIRRDLLAFTVPVVLCGMGIFAYNYARFGNPVEFGIRYLLGGDSYRNFRLSTTNFVRGLYYILVCPPDLVPEFPFIRLTMRAPFHSSTMGLPADYFLEPTCGVLSICPLVVLAAILPLCSELRVGHRRVYAFLATMVISAAGSILVLAAVPFSSQRYQVDFLPLLLLVACVVAAVLLGTLRQKLYRVFATIVLAAILLYGITANLFLGIQGPYDQFVQARPGSYVKLARWFSPVERFRPFLNPILRVRALYEFPWPCPPRKEPLLTAGEFGSRYLLSVQCAGLGRIRLISQTSVLHPDELSVELPFASRELYEVGLEFTPAERIMTVAWNGSIVLRHPLRFLVTARSQIQFGWDPTLGGQTRFDGRIVSPALAFRPQ